MPDSPFPDELTFKIHPAGGGSEVPVSILTQSLTTLQELIHLFALHEEGRTVRTRLRLPAEISNKYVLCCRPPVSGSFSVGARVGNLNGDAPAPDKIVRVMSLFHDFNRAAAEGNLGRMVELVPDGRVRDRAVSCVLKLSPPAGSGYRFELFNGAGPSVIFDESVPARLEKTLEYDEERSEVQTVTGSLEVISFSERTLIINYAPKGRWLKCSYDESIEPMLLENRRDLIQVTGRVIMDEENHPKQIVEVEQVRDLDLSPFVLGELRSGELPIKPRRSLQLQPELTESQQLICLEHPAWGLDVFASTRTELFEELKEQLMMLWTEYACEADERLSEPAQRVKRQMLEDWQEVQNAAG